MFEYLILPRSQQHISFENLLLDGVHVELDMIHRAYLELSDGTVTTFFHHQEAAKKMR
jgi:hypothetical protein